LPCPPPTPAPPDGPSTASPKSRSNPPTPTAPARDGAGHDAAAFSRTVGRLGRSWRRRSDCRFGLADSRRLIPQRAQKMSLSSSPSPPAPYGQIVGEVAKLQQRERDITQAQRRYV